MEKVKLIKDAIKRIPFSKALYKAGARLVLTTKTNLKIKNLKSHQANPLERNINSNLIVSLTSYPARIESVWITIESIFQQDYKPWKVVLVLAEEEFPGREIPETLDQQVKRGLEIIWTDRNTRSYKKLLPTRQKYPEAIIVTVDDDIIYEPWRLSRLVAATKKHPKAIIGHRGWEITIQNNKLRPYATWPAAQEETKEGRVLLTGVGGILYPPHSLNTSILFDIESALCLAPTADDLWFWAVATMSKTRSYCLGHEKHTQISPGDHENELSTINVAGGKNDEQLIKIVDVYNLMQHIT